MEEIQEKKSKRFILGVVLIAGSIAYGWIGLIGCNALAVRYGRFWFILGWIIYAISWVTYGLGFLLAGASGLAYAKRLFLQKGKKGKISS